MDCAGPSGPSPEQEAPGDAMWLLGNDSPCSASAGRGLITIKSRFMALLSHPVDELAALESKGVSLEWNCVSVQELEVFILQM